MALDDWRTQGAEACRAFFVEHADDFTELCKAGRSDVVMNSILAMAGIKAAERTRALEASEENTAFCEGFIAAADAEITVMRGRLPITLP